jgi:hypothetical protein
VDFGIALRQADIVRLTQGTPIGTVGYMSPEQEKGEEVSATSDVFSLGVLLYECLAGVRPALGGYKPLGLHNEAIPPTVDALIQDSLNDDPGRRPPTAGQFSERLNAALRPHSSFTSTLSEGSLHEIQLALSGMTPPEFSSLPPGQRVLVITRLADLATVDQESLRRAVAALTTELVRVAHTIGGNGYEKVVTYAFEYGYEKWYGETWQGNPATRSALNDVSLICGEEAHALISNAALALVNTEALKDRAGWYFHDLRILLQNLLINPVCSADQAESIGLSLTQVNSLSH